MGSSGPTYVRRQLGLRMRALRMKAGKSTVDVDTAGIVRRMTLHRIENGQTACRWPTIYELCTFYDADEDTRAALVELAKASKGTGWFEAYDDAIPQRLGMYLSAEQAASRISVYDPEVIFGTLQTPDYALALFQGEHPHDTAGRIDQLLEARLERQERFWRSRPNGAMLCVVLGEAAVAREVGSRATMRRQVDHLEELSRHRGVEVRILPWSAGAHPAIYGGWTTFEFPDKQDPTLVYLENYMGGQYLEEDREVSRMLPIWQKIYNQAIPIKEHKIP